MLGQLYSEGVGGVSNNAESRVLSARNSSGSRSVVAGVHSWVSGLEAGLWTEFWVELRAGLVAGLEIGQAVGLRARLVVGLVTGLRIGLVPGLRSRLLTGLREELTEGLGMGDGVFSCVEVWFVFSVLAGDRVRGLGKMDPCPVGLVGVGGVVGRGEVVGEVLSVLSG